MNAIKKISTAAVAALTLGLAIAASASPAEARWGRNGAFFGGAAVGLLGAAIVANSYSRPAYAAPVYGGACWTERRAVYNRFGDYVGSRPVRICN